MNDLDSLRQRLSQYDQQHLLRFWGDLSDAQRDALAAQIESIDFEQLERLSSGDQPPAEGNWAEEDWAELAARAEPPPAIRLGAADNPISLDDARARGAEAIAAGQVGAVLVAGGQGTRLGFHHPKGMLPIGVVSQATLFELHIEKLLAAARRHHARAPLYLMTSHATHDETVEFLSEHRRFGLAEDELIVFQQGEMPAVDIATGKLLLAGKGRVFTNPDGHGGLLAAMADSGALDDARRRGLRQLFYFQVDNPLIRVLDEALVGYHLLAESEMTTQVVAKRDPLERMGCVARIDGRLHIIEYSDLSEEIARRRDEQGELVFWAGNMAVHVFDVDFLQRASEDKRCLPLHRARKQVPHLDESGQRVKPEQPNAIKFERFIFDLLPAAREAIVVEADRVSTYSPIKNGPDARQATAATARAAMLALHTRWLQEAGALIDPGTPVEVGPLFARDAQELKQKIPLGMHIKHPTHFG